MSFLDNLGKTITTKGKEAAKKAKDLTETLQLKAQITTEKNEIQETYTQIGKKFYDENQSAADDSYMEYFEKIRLSFEKIDQLEKEINAIDGVRVCDSCGAKISEGSSFCTGCGKKVEPVQTEEVIVEESAPEDGEEVESIVVENPVNPEDGATVVEESETL